MSRAGPAVGDRCPRCSETLADASGVGRCPACRWREFAPAD